MAEKSIRATLHVGPFPGLSRVRWDATIGRVTVADTRSDVALHLFPDAAYELAAELVAAADAATGQRRRYDVARLVAENILIAADDVDPDEDDRFAQSAALDDAPDTVAGALVNLSREGKLR